MTEQESRIAEDRKTVYEICKSLEEISGGKLHIVCCISRDLMTGKLQHVEGFFPERFEAARYAQALKESYEKYNPTFEIYQWKPEAK